MTRHTIFRTILLLAIGAGSVGACAVAIDAGGGGEALEADGEPAPPMGVSCGGALCTTDEACCAATMTCYERTCAQCCPGALPPPVYEGGELGTVPAPDSPAIPAMQDPTLPIWCGTEQCDRGEACCLATGRCYPGDCADCCAGDIRIPAIPSTPGRADAGIGPLIPRPR